MSPSRRIPVQAPSRPSGAPRGTAWRGCNRRKTYVKDRGRAAHAPSADSSPSLRGNGRPFRPPWAKPTCLTRYLYDDETLFLAGGNCQYFFFVGIVAPQK